MPATGNSNDVGQGAAHRQQVRAFRDAAAATTAAQDSETGPDLDVLAREIMQYFAMLRAGLAGDFAARIKWARKYLPQASRAGAIRALQQERIAALAAHDRRAAQTVKAQLAGARRLRRRAAPSDAPKPAG